VVCFKSLSRNLPGGTEQNYRNPPVKIFGVMLNSQPYPCQIQDKRVTAELKHSVI